MQQSSVSVLQVGAVNDACSLPVVYELSGDVPAWHS